MMFSEEGVNAMRPKSVVPVSGATVRVREVETNQTLTAQSQMTARTSYRTSRLDVTK